MRCVVVGHDGELRHRMIRIARENGWHPAEIPAETSGKDAGERSIELAFVLTDDAAIEADVRRVRQTLRSAIVVVIGSASLQVRERALAAGATDFISHDFSSRYVKARVSALLRLRTSDIELRLTVGAIEIDRPHRRCVINNRELPLSPMEFDLLVLLAANYGRTLPRSELIEGLWRDEAQIEDNTLDVHISRLRRKLRNRCSDGIVATRGIGYRLVANR